MFSKNIVISGGTSLLNGFGDRIEKELFLLMKDLKSNFDITISGSNNSINSPFLGGNIMSEQDTFADMCIDKGDFKEIGSNIFSKKCNYFN